MSEEQPEVKNQDESQEKSEHINVKVVNADGNEVFFKIKKNTPLRKLMEAFCKRQGLQTNSVRFSFDGNRVTPDQTADQLGMEDNDVIDAMVEQTGGSF